MSNPLDTERLMSLAWQAVASTNKTELTNALGRFRENLTVRLHAVANTSSKAEPQQLMPFLMESYVTAITDACFQALLHVEIERHRNQAIADDSEDLGAITILLRSIALTASNALQQSLDALLKIAELLKFSNWETATVRYLYHTAARQEDRGQPGMAETSSDDSGGPPTVGNIIKLLNELSVMLAREE